MRKMLHLLLVILFLSGCSVLKPTHLDAPPLVEVFQLQTTTEIGKTPEGGQIVLGGFSGLIYEGRDPKTNEHIFLTLTDRGPNAPSPEKSSVKFLTPAFQLRFVRLSLNRELNTLKVVNEIMLTHNGKPLLGLPNVSVEDEIPVDANDKVLKKERFGIDPESIVRDDKGNFWVGEEYRPSLVKFSPKGELLERYVPKDGKKLVGTPVLPSWYGTRRMNRGFEGIAFSRGKIFAFLQSPLGPNSKTSSLVRILEFDPRTKKTTAEYAYFMEDAINDRKIGDAIALPSGDFLVLEQTSKKGKDTDKKIFRISLKDATVLSSLKGGAQKNWEGFSAEELKSRGLKPVKKELILDLGPVGLNFVEKAEGLAVLDSKTIAVQTDNDFGLMGENSYLVLLPVKGL